MPQNYSIAVMISGRGSNMRSLIEQARDYSIRAVFSDNPEAPGLETARRYGIPAQGFSRSDFPSRKEFKKAIFSAVHELKPDLVALAGFMQIVEPEEVEALRGRLINIHPSLLPAFAGLHTHERVLKAGEKQHGCSVHFVDAGVDTGPLIAQARCEVIENDSADTLAGRVLSFEHRLYPWVVNAMARGDISFDGRRVSYSPRALTEAAAEGFQTFGK